MKFFLDTANLKDIEDALKAGYIRGVTTNPSLLAKEPKGSYLAHMEKIIKLLKKYGGDSSLSVEVFSDEPKEMIKQALQFVKKLRYKNLSIKIPISFRGRSYLEVIRRLADKGISVNCTACMDPMQLVLGAAAGAKFVSLFYNRVKDSFSDQKAKKEREAALAQKIVEVSDFDPDLIIKTALPLLAGYDSEIIAGSIRNPIDVKKAGLAGAHIVTASPVVFQSALNHFKTDDAVARFLDDFAAWMK